MELEDAIRIVRLRWSMDGSCLSCGAQFELHEYGELREAVVVNTKLWQVELRCLADGGDTHRGVRIRVARDETL